MRRQVLLSPLALLASACAVEPAEPSMTAADWSAVPPAHDVQLPSREDALRRWLLPPTNAWAGYAKYTLLTALGERSTVAGLPDIEALDDVHRARAAAVRVAAAGLPADTLWIVDLRGAASVTFGVTLSRAPQAALAPSVALVPTFNNWPAQNELVPAEETLAALVSMSPALPQDDALGGAPVFLLDAWRMAFRSEEPDDDTYDNRYLLSPADLPDVSTLRTRGIRRVLYVVADLEDTNVEEDNLHPVFFEYRAAGIGVAMVDLNLLAASSPSTVWDDVFAEHALSIEPRVTIVDEPSFYVRARGGFGGIHARPLSPGWSSRGWGSRGWGSAGWGHGGPHGAHGAGG